LFTNKLGTRIDHKKLQFNGHLAAKQRVTVPLKLCFLCVHKFKTSDKENQILQLAEAQFARDCRVLNL
jgi:hypothetical protein